MEKILSFPPSHYRWSLLIFKRLVIILLLFLFAGCIGNIHAQLNVRATGTGQTTGIIANLMVTNSSDQPVTINEQTAYIPSDGTYQPYVATIPESTVPAKGITTIPVNGYCADIITPPVPAGTDMPPLNTWIPVGDPTGHIPEGTFNIIPSIPAKPFEPADIPGLLNSPGYDSHSPGEIGEIIATWPGSERPVGGTIDPQEYPEVFAPLIVDVLEKIDRHVDVILADENYATPFSNQPEKERESVIQQTFWIYMADVTGKEYTKPVFTGKVYEQFKEATGKTVASLPEEQKEKVEEGIEDFWNAFTAVGVEAKILRNPADVMDDPVLIDVKGDRVTIVDELSNEDKYKQDLKNCFFSKLEYSVFIEHKYTRGTGKNKKNSSDSYYPDDRNEVEIKLKRDDTLTINIINLKCTCLCWTSIDGGTGEKSGAYCDCKITGIAPKTSEAKAFEDLMEDDFDKFVMDSLRKEITKKLEDLKAAGGRKSEIDKLQNQLDDEKKMRRENAARISELKKSLNGPWRLNHATNQSEFKVKKGFYGQVEFVFEVQGTCAGDDTCKGSVFTREIKVKVTVPK